MTYCVALTGNIASGKSLVAKKFKEFGIDVFSADEIAKTLTLKGEPCYQQIVEHFGPQITLADETLDRKKLRDIIFNQPAEKLWLEKLLHPEIRRTSEKKIQESTSPYCVLEIPLLIEKTYYPYISKVLLVNAPQELQIQRVMHRDDCSKEQALTILLSQPSFEVRKPFSDFIIENDQSIDALNKQVELLHKKLLNPQE